MARLHVADSSVLFSATGDVPATPGNPPISGGGRRVMWYADKAAFRAGFVSGVNWDKDSIGDYSFATGNQTIASGYTSTAIGYNTNASGNYSTAMGLSTNASGDYSTAMGDNTNASGGISTAMGAFTNASGPYSTAMGYLTVASGWYSTAMGIGSVASGYYSTAMGDSSAASGLYAVAIGYKNTAAGDAAVAIGYSTTAANNGSTAMGVSTTANGPFSTAMGGATLASGDFSTTMGYATNASGGSSTALGWGTIAKAVGSLSAGVYNDDTDSPSSTAAPTDRIFQVGNGTSSTRSNAITVFRNGNTGIGTVTPNASLQFSNTTANRKIVLWETANNDHQFYGFGINGSTLRYQTPSGGDDHIFYSGFGTNSSTELLRIKGNGNLGVGVSDPAFRLDVGERMRIRSTPGNTAGVWLNNDFNNVSPAFIGMKSNDEVGFYGQTGTAGWRFYVNTTTGNGWMQGTLTQNSDQRLKKNISVLDNSLHKLIQLHGYHYYWKNETTDSNLQTGVLAQEVQKLFPELVMENKDGILAVNYSGLIPVMIESIKEQQQQIDELKKLVEKLINQ